MNFDKTVNTILERQYSWLTQPIERLQQEVGKRLSPQPTIDLPARTPEELAKIKPGTPLPTQAEYEAEWQKDITPEPATTTPDFNTPGFSTQAFDQSLQQIQRSNPSFDSQAYGDWAKGVVTGMMESERIAGRSQDQMEKTFQDELQRYINMAPQYINKFPQSGGITPQQSYTSTYMGSSPQVVGTATKSGAPDAIAQHAKTGQWNNQPVMTAKKSY